MQRINLYIIIINIASLFFMGIDKLLAIKNKRRISEISLLTICAIGGSLGTLLGMFLFKHKIKKPKFLILVPLFLILLIITYKKIPLN